MTINDFMIIINDLSESLRYQILHESAQWMMHSYMFSSQMNHCFERIGWANDSMTHTHRQSLRFWRYFILEWIIGCVW